MEERRGKSRRHLYYYSRVYDEETHEMAGRLVDISTKGMMIVSEEPVKTDARFKFKLVLPRAIEGKKALYLEAKSKWSRQAGNRELFDNGFELINIVPKTSDMIDKLIDSACSMQ